MPQKVSARVGGLSILSGYIIKVFMSANSYIGSLLCKTELHK